MQIVERSRTGFALPLLSASRGGQTEPQHNHPACATGYTETKNMKSSIHGSSAAMFTATALILNSAILASMTAVDRARILAGPITNSANGHLYYLLTTNTWVAAEAEAVAIGGHLVTINDEAEHQWVYTKLASFSGAPKPVWIGLTDQDIEGSFHWISGETSTYRNWHTGEPNNNENGNEDYVITAQTAPGRWNDRESSARFLGVAEVIPGVASRMSIRRAVEVAWTSQTTNRYQVQWASGLETNNWFNLGSIINGGGTTNYIFDTVRDGEKKFYRVLTLP